VLDEPFGGPLRQRHRVTSTMGARTARAASVELKDTMVGEYASRSVEAGHIRVGALARGLRGRASSLV
jgi:hypothetical protein